MRVHPAPRKRNIAFRCDASPRLSAAGAGDGGRQKKLRRLPHIFSKVLELPLGSDADVSFEEGPDGFRFVAATDDLWDDVRAHAIEIHPGVMKVVVRDGHGKEEEEEELDLDRWRFRLPPSSRPALATAAYTDGELVVTIPKAE
ncbi:17.4 kDa class I heat shock protein-like [Phoenix dactylifera]|uniref:17.4 kDa class I heat shock protein-like n=1 Tax=Phoenix dactylifera TaxID=42345 RepID=A0A8B7BK17_PHODC|nr:17.4 kDa class I heat shock protein-like [Phoenix dactylifera]